MRATPTEEGFSARPDWEAAGRIWLAWPSRPDAWAGGLEEAQDGVATLARAAAAFAPVTIIAPPEMAPAVSIRSGAGVSVLPCAVDEPWAHDFGPTFVQDSEGDVAGVDWRYKAWGGARRAQTDRGVAPHMLENLGMARFQADFPGEGGLFQVDGEGTALASLPGLSHEGRSPKFDRDKADAMLRDMLGVTTVIWLDCAVEGDEAARLDALLAYVAPGRVVLSRPRGADDPLYPAFQAAETALGAARDAAGRALDVIPLPAPKPRLRMGGMRAPFSYAGFLLAGTEGLLVPVFDEYGDEAAMDALASAFPTRIAQDVSARAFAMGGATLRAAACLQPAGPPAP